MNPGHVWHLLYGQPYTPGLVFLLLVLVGVWVEKTAGRPPPRARRR